MEAAAQYFTNRITLEPPLNPPAPMKTNSPKLLLFAAVAIAMTATSGAQTILFDMGRKDGGTNGTLVSNPATPIAGSGTFYWNSFGNSTQTQSGSFSNFVDVLNSPLVGWSISNLSANMQANGLQNGGLAAGATSLGIPTGENPSFSNLGIFAVSAATGDYWFVDGGAGASAATASFSLSGLDNAKTYNFTFFGSRWIDTETRATTYRAIGAGGTLSSAPLVTSGVDVGADGYDGNNNTTVSLNGVQPVSGAITIEFSNSTGRFGYLNAMQVDVVPEPTTNALLILAALAGSWLSFRRKSKVSN